MNTEKRLEDARAEVARLERELRDEKLAREDAATQDPLARATERKVITRAVWEKLKLDGKAATAFFKSGGRVVD